jgi:hypothetical protein
LTVAKVSQKYLLDLFHLSRVLGHFNIKEISYNHQGAKGRDIIRIRNFYKTL